MSSEQQQQPQPPDNAEPLSPLEGGPLGPGIDWADPNSRLAPLYLTPLGLVATAVLGLAIILFAGVPLRHTDFWAHLKYGEWIAATHTLPVEEPLCPFTDKQTPMFDSLWLSQVVYHDLFRMGSALAKGDEQRRLEGAVEAIRITHMCVSVAVLGLLGLAYRRVSDSVAWSMGGMLLVLALMFGGVTMQRPQAFSLLGFAAVLMGLSRPLISRWAVVWMPLLFILWANLHGAFVVGFGLIGAVLIGRVVEVLRGEGGSFRAVRQDTAVRRLILVLGLGVIGVSCLTPHGPTLLLDIVRFGSHPNLRTFVEWQPLDFTEAQGGHWAYLALAVLLVGTFVASRQVPTTTQIILILSLGVWPVLQQRAMVWWIMVYPWIIAPHWVAAAERWAWRLPEMIPDFRRTVLAVVVAMVAVFVSSASTWLKTGNPRPLTAALHPGTPNDIAAALTGGTPADPERVKELVRAIREGYGGRYVGPVFSSEIQGEYLLWALPSDAPVMLFNHAQLFTVDYWTECMKVKEGEAGWQEFLDRHQAKVVVVELDQHERLCQLLARAPGWRVVLNESDAPVRDGYARLFVAVRKPR